MKLTAPDRFKFTLAKLSFLGMAAALTSLAHAENMTWVCASAANWNLNSPWRNSTGATGAPTATDNIAGATSFGDLRANNSYTIANFTYSGTNDWRVIATTQNFTSTVSIGTLTRNATTNTGTLTFRQTSVSNSQLLVLSATNIVVSNGYLDLGTFNTGAGSQIDGIINVATTSVSGGALRINADVDYGLGLLSMTGGNVVLNSSSVASNRQVSVSGLSGSGGGSIQASQGTVSGSAVLTINSATATTTAAILSDGGSANSRLSLVKTGVGKQTLQGASTYSGGTQIQQGALEAANASALGSGAVSVSSVGTLLTSVSNVTVGSLTMTSGTTDLGGSAASDSLTLTGSGQTFSLSGGTLKISLTSGVADSIIGAAGQSFSITGGTLDLSNSAWNYAASYTILSGFGSGTVSGLTITGYDTVNQQASLSNSGVLSFTAVPEPGSVALLGVGGLMLWTLRRRAGSR